MARSRAARGVFWPLIGGGANGGAPPVVGRRHFPGAWRSKIEIAAFAAVTEFDGKNMASENIL